LAPDAAWGARRLAREEHPPSVRIFSAFILPNPAGIRWNWRGAPGTRRSLSFPCAAAVFGGEPRAVAWLPGGVGVFVYPDPGIELVPQPPAGQSRSEGAVVRHRRARWLGSWRHARTPRGRRGWCDPTNVSVVERSRRRQRSPRPRVEHSKPGSEPTSPRRTACRPSTGRPEGGKPPLAR
jgi:hypothetical protein